MESYSKLVSICPFLFYNNNNNNNDSSHITHCMRSTHLLTISSQACVCICTCLYASQNRLLILPNNSHFAYTCKHMQFCAGKYGSRHERLLPRHSKLLNGTTPVSMFTKSRTIRSLIQNLAEFPQCPLCSMLAIRGMCGYCANAEHAYYT